MTEADPRLLKLVRQVDDERQRRVVAERQVRMLKAAIVRLSKTRDGDVKSKPAQRTAR
jgi:hypothetical protein